MQVQVVPLVPASHAILAKGCFGADLQVANKDSLDAAAGRRGQLRVLRTSNDSPVEPSRDNRDRGRCQCARHFIPPNPFGESRAPTLPFGELSAKPSLFSRLQVFGCLGGEERTMIAMGRRSLNPRKSSRCRPTS